MSARRRRFHARFVAAGFWAQLVFLGLVDWGSLYAMSKVGVSWPVLTAFIGVNGILLALAVVMRRWIRGQDGRTDG